MTEGKEHWEQQMAEKDNALQVKLRALETRISRSLAATINVTWSMEDQEIKMQAQINRMKTAHARVAEQITDNLTA